MTLGDFVTLQRGHDLPESKRRLGNVPVIGSFGITGYHDIAKAKGPGVTIGRSGASFGVVSYSPVNYWPHNAALYVTDFHGNDERFSYYFLKSIDFKNYNSGSAQPSLNRNYIYPIEIKVPPVPIQRKIAGILSAYDRLIENNTRRIEILEEMARSIYREWFVKFRFPGHEQVQMVDSELGLIPEDWEVKKLGEVIRFKNGKSIKVEEEGDYLVYGSNGIIGRTNEARYQNAIIIGRVGAYCGSLIYSKSAFNASDNTIIAESASEKFSLELAFYVLEQMNLRHYAGGAAQPLLTQTVIKEIPAIVPDIKTNKNFQIIIANLINFKSNLTNKIQNLCQTRDLLLPRLISGEIDVENLDINTGEIAA